MKHVKTQIIFDLEATCEDKSINPHFDNETIEIGAVKIVGKEIVDEFQAFIKPVRSGELTNFCKELTHITQEQVDHGQSFAHAIASFRNWAGEGAEFLSWGFYDRKQLEKDCKYHGISADWLHSHRSIKHEHQAIKGLKRGVGVVKALRMEGLQFEGTHHRGIDDAKNIAKVFLKMFED